MVTGSPARKNPAASSRVLEVDPVDDARWLGLASSRRSDVFHSPRWISVVRDAYGFDIRARIIGDAERAQAGVVLTDIEDFLSSRTVGLPFSDFCDPLVDGLDEWRALVGDLLHSGRPLKIRTLFDRVTADDPELAVLGTAAWHRADVTLDPDESWRRLDPGARRAIKKARAAGVRVRRGDSLDDMRTFFDLHRGVRKHKYGLLPQPWSFFRLIWERLVEPGAGDLLLAERSGAILGGVLFLRWQETCYYKFNASSPDALEYRPNDIVLWEGLIRSHESGLRWLDFGVSDLDQPGLVRYKAKYATEQGEVVTRGTVASPTVDHDDSGRVMLNRLTALFVRPDVPDEVTESAGDVLYRYFA